MIEFVKNNLLLVALAVGSGSMLLFQLFKGGSGGVTTAQATSLINRENARVLDVRASTDYVAGHISGASNIPLENLSTRIAELDKFKTRALIVYCKSGNSSKSACSILRKAGFEQVFNLAGGIAAWEQAGLPLSTKGKK